MEYRYPLIDEISVFWHCVHSICSAGVGVYRVPSEAQAVTLVVVTPSAPGCLLVQNLLQWVDRQ